MTVEEIIKNKSELIAIKKGVIKHSDTVCTLPMKNISETIKLEIGDDTTNKRVVANTYYWLDSHGDVHVKGIFTKSIKESVIFHFDNHNHSFASKVGEVKSVKEITINWQDLGVEKDGTTICLIGETELIEDYNKQIYNAYKNNQITQHSVGMQYVTIDLAVNNPLETEYYKRWNEVYPMLGNPEKADEMGYFWIVREAKLKEYSSVLWNGSNSLTPTIEDKTEAEEITSETTTEPTIEVTQTKIKRRRII